MTLLGLMLREIRYRKLGFLSSVIAVTAAVAALVAVVTMSEAAERETKRLMRDLGFNLLILPGEEDLGAFWARGYATSQMPEEYVYRLSESRAMLVRHLVARLQEKIRWRGQTIILTGISPEVPMKHLPRKSPMSPKIKRGTALVGYLVARRLGIRRGQVIDIRGRKFYVVKCLPEAGGPDDIRVYVHLADAQELLGAPGRINEIEALGCVCFGWQDIGAIRAEVKRALPGVQVVQLQTIAQVRARTRHMMEKYAAVLVPLVLLASGLWVFLQALANVRERRSEIGILRALGVSGWRIAALLLSKAVAIGVVGGAAGFGVGTWAALRFGPQVFSMTARKIHPDPALLGLALLLAPALAVIASYIPTVLAVIQDPAEVLRQE